jgi:hypothetical protein
MTRPAVVAGKPWRVLIDGFETTPVFFADGTALHAMDLSAGTELWSLGTGATPFDAKALLQSGLDAMRKTIRETEPLRPSTRLSTMVAADLVDVSRHHGADAPKLIREMRGDLDWIVMKALEKDRARRYATANGLAMDIGRYLSDEAVLARPPSASYKLRKLVSRNKVVCLGIVLIFLLLVVSLITTTRWLMVEKRTREQMRQQMEIVRLEGLGWSLIYQRKYTDGEQMFLKSLSLRRQFQGAGSMPALTFRLLVLSFIDQQRFNEVKPFLSEFLDPALASRVDYKEVLEFASAALAQRGQWNDADALAEQARKSDPTNSFAYHLRAPLLVAKGPIH